MVADGGTAADALVLRGREGTGGDGRGWEVQVAGLRSHLVRPKGRRFGERVGQWEEQEFWSQTD